MAEFILILAAGVIVWGGMVLFLLGTSGSRHVAVEDSNLYEAPVWSAPFPEGACDSAPPQKLRILRSVLERIENTVGSMPAEQGGMLGGNRQDYVIRHFAFDRSARRNGAQYSPNRDHMNAVLKNE